MTQTTHQHINITAILKAVTGMGVSEPVSRDVGVNSTPSRTVLDDFMQHRPIQPPPRPRDFPPRSAALRGAIFRLEGLVG